MPGLVAHVHALFVITSDLRSAADACASFILDFISFSDANALSAVFLFSSTAFGILPLGFAFAFAFFTAAELPALLVSFPSPALAFAPAETSARAGVSSIAVPSCCCLQCKWSRVLNRFHLPRFRKEVAKAFLDVQEFPSLGPLIPHEERPLSREEFSFRCHAQLVFQQLDRGDETVDVVAFESHDHPKAFVRAPYLFRLRHD